MTKARTTTLAHRLLAGAAMTVMATAIGATAPQDNKAAAPAMSGAGDSALVKKTADGMVGHWLSTEGETRPNGQGGQNYLKRDFTNTPALAKAALIFFKDGAYKDKTFTLVASGPYKFVKPSAAVAGSVETDLIFKRSHRRASAASRFVSRVARAAAVLVMNYSRTVSRYRQSGRALQTLLGTRSLRAAITLME